MEDRHDCQGAEKHRAKSDATSGAGKSLSTQRARLADAQATKAEFNNAVVRGDYVKVSVMERYAGVLFTTFREQSLGMAGKTADSLTPFTPKDRAEIYEIIQREMRQMLEEFSDPNGVIGRAISETATRAKAKPDGGN
jgi:capsid protein